MLLINGANLQTIVLVNADYNDHFSIILSFVCMLLQKQNADLVLEVKKSREELKVC